MKLFVITTFKDKMMIDNITKISFLDNLNLTVI